ncbi:Transcriptional regulator (Phage-related) protein [Bacillus cereus m1550]|nr:Transcriptional regulator (Phage-related) protein [Bacillus cereus m1550]
MEGVLMSYIKERLKRLRKLHNLKQRDVAEYLDISESAYGYYEQGRNEPSLDSVRKLAEKYDVSVSYLLGETDEEGNYSKTSDEYDPITEISKYIQQLGIDNMGFFDIEKWKNLSPEDVEEIKKHFDYVVFKAIQNKQK